MKEQEEIDAALAFRWLWELVDKYPLAAKGHHPYMHTLCMIHLELIAADTRIAKAIAEWERPLEGNGTGIFIQRGNKMVSILRGGDSDD